MQRFGCGCYAQDPAPTFARPPLGRSAFRSALGALAPRAELLGTTGTIAIVALLLGAAWLYSRET